MEACSLALMANQATKVPGNNPTDAMGLHEVQQNIGEDIPPLVSNDDALRPEVVVNDHSVDLELSGNRSLTMHDDSPPALRMMDGVKRVTEQTIHGGVVCDEHRDRPERRLLKINPPGHRTFTNDQERVALFGEGLG